jgi:hypothetical protein
MRTTERKFNIIEAKSNFVVNKLQMAPRENKKMLMC